MPEEYTGVVVPMVNSHQEGRVSIRGLGARTCGPHHQALFWENPHDETLLAYEFRIVLQSGVVSPWHSIAADKLPCRDWKTHSVLIYHNLDNPWDLMVELRGVNGVHHGDPQVSIHLAAIYEVQYTEPMWKSRNPRGQRPYIAIGLDDAEDQTTGPMRDISDGMLRLTMKEDQSLEEAQSKATTRGARHRRQGDDWIVPSATARRTSFDHVRPTQPPSLSYTPEHMLGNVLERRDWDLRVYVDDSGEVWFTIREHLAWERGYELSLLRHRQVPSDSVPQETSRSAPSQGRKS